MKHLFFSSIYILVILLILTWVIPTSAIAVDFDENNEKDARNFANEHDTWVICYQQGVRNSDFYQYDATDNFIFFSYSEYSCVDVYNMDGIFQFTLIFPNKQNGGVNVRCIGNNVYISTKDSEVYVFDGTQEIAHLSRDEAVSNGYDSSWFRNKDGCMAVDSEWISIFDTNGTIIIRIQTPTIIKQTIPPVGLELLIKPFVVIVSVLFLAIANLFRKKNRN